MGKDESSVENAIIDYLRLAGWFAFRLKNRAAYSAQRNCYLKPSPGQIRGIPDILAAKRGYPALVVEVKRPASPGKPKGRPSKEQIEFMIKWLGAGQLGLFAYSVQDVINYIGEYGHE